MRQVTFGKKMSRDVKRKSANNTKNLDVDDSGDHDDDLTLPTRYEGDVQIFPYFFMKVKRQISEGGAFDTATGVRVKMAIPEFDTTTAYSTDSTGQLTRANDLTEFGILKEAALANNKKFKAETTIIVKSIGDHVSEFIYSQLKDTLHSRDPVASYNAFVSLGGDPNINLGHNGKTRLTRKEFSQNWPKLSIMTLIAFLQMSIENINFHYPDSSKISSEESLAILVEKVGLITPNNEFEFTLEVIKLGGPDINFRNSCLLLMNKERDLLVNNHLDSNIRTHADIALGTSSKSKNIIQPFALSTVTACTFCQSPDHVADNCTKYFNCDQCSSIHRFSYDNNKRMRICKRLLNQEKRNSNTNNKNGNNNRNNNNSNRSNNNFNNNSKKQKLNNNVDNRLAAHEKSMLAITNSLHDLSKGIAAFSQPSSSSSPTIKKRARDDDDDEHADDSDE